MYPYHYQPVQELYERDREAGVQFCNWLLQENNADPTFLGRVLFTDESQFTQSGVINFHTNHHWSLENPHVYRRSHMQRQFTVNVWAGILDDHLIGSFRLPPCLTGNAYLHFLNSDLPVLEDIEFQTRRNAWFMYDGTPPHFTFPVRTFLHDHYLNWIGRGQDALVK
ncbi:hypothetical protein RF55_5481 [Lasius niger]|uniref:Transposable element tc3 transposase n=1 Tax=Lasius niger TaxID=67767 RepID=A0A0J7NPF8_LASNI|nr:hypothetical protein RF55_5481 [Lasius niger]